MDSNRGSVEAQSKGEGIHPFLLFAVLAVIGWALYLIIVSRALDSWAERGQFGDMFGGLNTLFSGLTLAGVIYAVVLQRKDLHLQREELQLTREELKTQTQVLSGQLATMQQSLSFEQKREKALSRPHLISRQPSTTTLGRAIQLENRGGTITDIHVRRVVPDDFKLILSPMDSWDDATKVLLKIVGDIEKTCTFDLAYTDRIGRRRWQRFEMRGGACPIHRLGPERAVEREDD